MNRFRVVLAIVATLALVMLAVFGGIVASEVRHQGETQRRAVCYTEVQAEVSVVIARNGLFQIQDWEYDHPRRLIDWLAARSFKCP